MMSGRLHDAGMHPFLMQALPPLVLLAAIMAPAAAPAQDEVTIYRCTDGQGRLALQDFPCAEGEQQQIRTMARPQPPAGADRAAPIAPEPPPAADPPPVAVDITIRPPPRPMYECTTPDGERYTSDNGDGNPRPAPTWNWGGPWSGPAPGVGPGPRGSSDRRAAGIASPGMSTSPGPSLTRPSADATAPPPRPRPPGHPHYPVYGYGDNDGLIRDQCHPLPQSRVCSLLGDRRTEIRRRMFNAQPSERAVLREEERDISARLLDDCDTR